MPAYITGRMTDAAQDWRLLRQYVEDNSQEAFEHIVSTHIDMIYSAALRQTGSRALAEDVTQAVFVTLARKAASIRRHTVLSAWLHRTARYTAMNALKMEARRRHHEREAALMARDLRRVDESWHRLAPDLDAAVAALGELDRAAIVLRFFQQLSVAEVGRALGISEDAAGMRILRALGKLRSFFSRRGTTLSAAALGGLLMANSLSAAPQPLEAGVMAAARGGASARVAELSHGAARMMAADRARHMAMACLLTAAVLGLAWAALERALDRPAPTAPSRPVVETRWH